MKSIILAISLILFSSTINAEICDTSKDPIDVDIEDKLLTDTDFSFNEALLVINRIEKNMKTNPAEIYINDVTVLKGHILLNLIKSLQLESEKYKAQGFNVDGIQNEIKDAKQAYCSYRKTARLNDI